MRQMNTLRSNSASLLKSNAVTKAWQSLGHGLAIVAAILTERAQTALQLLRFTLHRRIVREHSAQSALQTTPGLPERPPP